MNFDISTTFLAVKRTFPCFDNTTVLVTARTTLVTARTAVEESDLLHLRKFEIDEIRSTRSMLKTSSVTFGFRSTAT